MLHALNRIGIIKRTTEHLSRRRAAREPRATGTLADQEGQKKKPEIPEPSLVLGDEDYLLVDIKDDGTAEASRVDPGCGLGLVLVGQKANKAPAGTLNPKGVGNVALRGENFEDVPL